MSPFVSSARVGQKLYNHVVRKIPRNAIVASQSIEIHVNWIPEPIGYIQTMNVITYRQGTRRISISRILLTNKVDVEELFGGQICFDIILLQRNNFGDIVPRTWFSDVKIIHFSGYKWINHDTALCEEVQEAYFEDHVQF